MTTKSEIKSLKSLQLKKYRDEEKSFLVEGKRSVDEAINYNHGIEAVYVSHELAETDSFFINKLDSKSIRYEILKAKDIDAISDVKNNQGIIAKVSYLNYNKENIIKTNNLKNRIVILDGISDPGNMGTIIRTADWFGIDGIVLFNECVDIYNPKVVRSTMGSIFHLPVIEASDSNELFAMLKENKFVVYAADLEGESYKTAIYADNTAIVFGNEAHGISSNTVKFIDRSITIPRIGEAESLNVAISAGIIISHIAF